MVTPLSDLLISETSICPSNLIKIVQQIQKVLEGNSEETEPQYRLKPVINILEQNYAVLKRDATLHYLNATYQQASSHM